MRHLASVCCKLSAVSLLGLLIALLAGPAVASTYTVSSGTNTSLGTAQPISLKPDLVINQNGSNYTFGTAQPVSPNYYAYDVLGGILPSRPQEFFAFPANDGNLISMLVRGQNPPHTVSGIVAVRQQPKPGCYRRGELFRRDVVHHSVHRAEWRQWKLVCAGNGQS